MYSPNSLARSFRDIFIFSLVVLSTFLPARILAQIQIWGASSTGGADGIGSIFNVLDNGNNFDDTFNFRYNAEGHTANSPLVVGSDGAYYGTTSLGGDFNNGTIYRFSASQELTILHHFDGIAGGANSQTNLIEISAGIFVGCASSGGANGVGLIFQYSLSEGFEVLHHFVAATDGAAPSGQIVLNENQDAFYGTCINGGQQGFGTIYSYSFNSGDLTQLHSFTSSATGSNPRGGLTLGSDDLYYGTCQFGGLNGFGNIFRFDESDLSIQVLYDLNSTNFDGRFPSGSLIESSPGVFLGTCSTGGITNAGTIFRITSSGTFTRLRSLNSGTDGSSPKSGLTSGGNGFFFGVTEFGGAGGGTFYRIDEAGSFLKLRNLSASTDGINGLVKPTLISTNILLVPLSNGGATNDGTILQYTIGGSFVKQHDFSLPITGSTPQSLFTIDNGFLGSTFSGGSYNAGVLFYISISGETTNLHDFNPTSTGQQPNGQFCATGTGEYIGTTQFGGLFGSGTIFKTDLQGNLTTLHHFDGSDGGLAPFGGLVKHSDGFYYGTTSLGGLYGEGIVYRINESGEFTYLQSCFGFFDGGNPTSTPTEGPDGMVYFTNRTGGNSNAGSLVYYDPNSESITAVHHFTNVADGGSPKGKILTGVNGEIYGSTTTGGLGGGTFFGYSPTNGFSTIHQFNPATEGSMPEGGVEKDSNGKIYGFCKQGGSNNVGSLYAYDLDQNFEILYTFSGTSPQPNGLPAFFYPECFDASTCATTDQCHVAFCNFGLCEEAAINPIFTTTSIGNCDPATNGYSLNLHLELSASPGGQITIGDQNFDLDSDIFIYDFELTGLNADGAEIILDYSFDVTGCIGTTDVLGTAPMPCPPVILTLTLHTEGLAISSEGLFVGGSFQGWNPSQYPMTLVEPDLYSIEIPLTSGQYEYNFFNGSSIFDGEYAQGSCAVNGKRQLTIDEEDLAFEYCWANCAVTCIPSGLDDRLLTNMKVWPNPVSSGGQLNLELADGFENARFRIWSIEGKLVQTGSKMNGGIITLNALVSGIYTLEITNDQGQLAAFTRIAVR